MRGAGESERAVRVSDHVDIEGIVGVRDPIARNYAITDGYHRLSMQMGTFVCHENANWTTFGQYASAAAGRTIRGENGWLQKLLAPRADDVVAEGNRAIFADIAPPYEALIALLRAHLQKAEADELRGWLDRDILERRSLDVSDTMAVALRAYLEAAIMKRDALARGDDGVVARRAVAQQILKGNLAIAAHEQELAQPFIERAIPDTVAWVLGRIFNALPTDDICELATGRIELDAGDEHLWVCRDVPRPRYLEGAQYPDDLLELEDPWIIEQLPAWDNQKLNDTTRSDADNWQEYAERMGYIFHFFRSYQRMPGLFDGPADVRR